MAAKRRASFPAWGNTNALKAWQSAAAMYKGIDADAVTQAAVRGGGAIKTACQDLIFTQPDLEDYQAVAERTTVWAAQNNVFVGIPEGDPLKEEADRMNETVFPVIETAFDAARQDAVAEFETALRGGF